MTVPSRSRRRVTVLTAPNQGSPIFRCAPSGSRYLTTRIPNFNSAWVLVGSFVEESPNPTHGSTRPVEILTGDFVERSIMSISVNPQDSRRKFDYLRDATIYAGSELWPRAVVWLGQTGYLRYQRFVEVHVAPYRWDPTRGELVVQQEVEFRVDFNRTGGLEPRPVAARDSDLFEQVYRDAFINGNESENFRVVPEPTSLLERSSVRFPGARRKILVRSDGVVRLDFNRMNGSGFLVEPISTWRLESRGLPIPLDTNDDGDDLLESGEWVQFYGQALDEEPHTELNLDIANTNIDLFEARDFGDENVYFLTVAAASTVVDAH